MSAWTLVEPCCGSAALTLHMLGARRSLVPYQGTKWSVRRPLEGVVRGCGVWGQPARVVLSDAGPWAEAVRLVLDTYSGAVATVLAGLVQEGEADPEGLYARLVSEPVPWVPEVRAAVLLWLQRMSFSAKAVGVRDSRWVVHGLNSTSAHGCAGTERFGEIKPQGRGLLEAVCQAPTLEDVTAHRGLAPPVRTDDRTVVYLDPPYQGTEPYPCGHLTRDEVVDYARAWTDVGAAVIVSEAEPIADLVEQGWTARRIRGPGRAQGRQRFRRATRGEEWVTVWRAA